MCCLSVLMSALHLTRAQTSKKKGLQCEQQQAAGELERMLLWKFRRAGEQLCKLLYAFQKETDHQHPSRTNPTKSPHGNLATALG